MRQNLEEFHRFREYLSQIQNLVSVDRMADSGISLLRSCNVIITSFYGQDHPEASSNISVFVEINSEHLQGGAPILF